MGTKHKRHYDSRQIKIHNVEKNLQHIRTISPGVEPPENRETIANFFKEQRLDKEWKKRRRLKGE